ELGNRMWILTGTCPANEMLEARLQIHYAAHLISAAAQTLAPKRDDDSQQSLRFDVEQGAFVGEPLPSGVRVVLLASKLRVAVLDSTGDEFDSLGLDGKTFGGALDWLAAALGRATHSSAVPLVPP